VFLDEAGELLPEIERHRLRWRADNQQREALGEVRRALHTLKAAAAWCMPRRWLNWPGAPSTC
jgi:chemotaxis protein histidine kinase CheA